jgi:DNA-binding HxlR family transcriptional regulator
MGKLDERQRLKSMSFKRSNCPVACTLDIIGDKWTLLVIRDLLFGKTRYKEFQDAEERIPTNILANRLHQLENTGLIYRVPYQDRPVRYEYRLTETGNSLKIIIGVIARWANKHLPGTHRSPAVKIK